MSLWRWTALLAVGAIAIIAGFGAIPGMRDCGGGDPIFAFEMARSPAEAEALFAPSCRAAHIAAQRSGLYLDIAAFVPVYALFLILGFLSLAREGAARTAAYAGIAMVVVAAAFDQYENFQLLGILERFPGAEEDFTRLAFAPRAKFALLGLAVAVAGALHFVRPGWRKLAGGAAAIGGLASTLAVFLREDLVIEASALGWLALIAAAIALAFRRTHTT